MWCLRLLGCLFFCQHPVRWTAAGGEPMVSDGSSFSGSKRRKTTTTTAQGPHSRLQGSSAKPRNTTAAAKVTLRLPSPFFYLLDS